MAKSVVGMFCFVAAALASECCSAQTIVGPSGKPLQGAHRAKCSQSPTGYYEQATRDCKGARIKSWKARAMLEDCLQISSPVRLRGTP
jgi:hypothetical protein